MKTKLIILLSVLASLTACSSAPVKKLYKNCEEAGKGSGIFYCEELPEKQIGKSK